MNDGKYFGGATADDVSVQSKGLNNKMMCGFKKDKGVDGIVNNHREASRYRLNQKIISKSVTQGIMQQDKGGVRVKYTFEEFEG